MRFSKLRLNGFKSFVDPTDLVIAEGLTGVVGPNGCGKSNLLEALRWVMGENRPTAMRGGGMEDVIYADHARYRFGLLGQRQGRARARCADAFCRCFDRLAFALARPAGADLGAHQRLAARAAADP